MTPEIQLAVKIHNRIIHTKSPNHNYEYWIARNTLLDKDSYRLPSHARNDLWIGFKQLYRVIRRWSQNKYAPANDISPEALILGGYEEIFDDIISYVSSSSRIQHVALMSRDIKGFGHTFNITSVLVYLVFAFPIAVKCVFKKRRDNYALAMSSVLELAYILKYTSQKNIRYVFDFVPYECDSNFFYIALKQRGVTVCKVPSTGPISVHYLHTLTDDFVITNPYHMEELEARGKHIHYSKLLNWPPYRSKILYDKFCVNRIPTKSNTVGFYSHGEWIRSKQGHADYGSGIGHEELRILNMLKKIKANRPEIIMRVFPHPRETQPKIISETREHYDSILGVNNYELCILDGGSVMNFDKADVAVISYSTIIYERLYCGFKTLISLRAIDGFPITGSVLNNICFDEPEDFEKKISAALEQSHEEFFDSNKLTPFLWSHLPIPENA